MGDMSLDAVMKIAKEQGAPQAILDEIKKLFEEGGGGGGGGGGDDMNILAQIAKLLGMDEKELEEELDKNKESDPETSEDHSGGSHE